MTQEQFNPENEVNYISPDELFEAVVYNTFNKYPTLDTIGILCDIPEYRELIAEEIKRFANENKIDIKIKDNQFESTNGRTVFIDSIDKGLDVPAQLYKVLCGKERRLALYPKLVKYWESGNTRDAVFIQCEEWQYFNSK